MTTRDYNCTITPSASCTLDSETGFTLTIRRSDNNENGHVSLFAPSASSAQHWVEAICAVRYTLSLHPDKRSNTSQKILSRFRFDLLQTISIVNKQSYNRTLIPKDVMQVIGNYLIHL
jgi:hypothetical protein